VALGGATALGGGKARGIDFGGGGRHSDLGEGEKARRGAVMGVVPRCGFRGGGDGAPRGDFGEARAAWWCRGVGVYGQGRGRRRDLEARVLCLGQLTGGPSSYSSA
jgi:hypothetical protein